MYMAPKVPLVTSQFSMLIYSPQRPAKISKGFLSLFFFFQYGSQVGWSTHVGADTHVHSSLVRVRGQKSPPRAFHLLFDTGSLTHWLGTSPLRPGKLALVLPRSNPDWPGTDSNPPALASQIL